MKAKFFAGVRVAFRAALAGVTSPKAVKMERGLAALVAVRVLLALGASVGLVEFVNKLIGG